MNNLERNFLLEQILLPEMNQKERVISILIARGFLIDCIDGKYFMSDNASVGDVVYLKELFDKYKIGEITNIGKYTISKRRCWGETFSRSYTYDSIIPCCNEIFINECADDETVFNLFHDKGQIGGEAGSMTRSWQEFSIEELGPKVNVRWLEAYVAYYVKAISACGVFTSYSCDGNHKNGGMICICSDYPSRIWHECIWNYIVRPCFGDIPFIEKGLYFSDTETQKKTYILIYKIADFLYKNRIKIRNIKMMTVRDLSKKYLALNKNRDVIEIKYRYDCMKIISGINVLEMLK